MPLLRGLVKLASAVAPLLASRGVARPRERWLLAAAVIATFALVVVPDPFRLIGEGAPTAALVGWMLRGRTLFFHGAEHRAISAAEQRRLTATWSGTVEPTRFAARCGTNFAVLVLPVALLLNHLAPLSAAACAPVLVSLLALALTMELWLAQSGRGWWPLLLVPGLAVQRLTTREPRLDETRVALTALASVVRRELALETRRAAVAADSHRSAA